MRNLLLFSALVFGVSAAGRADTTFYLINNTYGPLSASATVPVVDGSAVGTFNIDTATGLIDAVNVTVSEEGSTYIFTGMPSAQGTINSSMPFEAQTTDADGDILDILLPVASLVGYSGGPLCTVNNLCPDGQSNFYASSLQVYDPTSQQYTYFGAASGSLATTPEPSSLILLGTGLAAVSGAARRRLATHRS